MVGFAEAVGNFEKKTVNKLDLAKRKIALEVFTEVIMMSPVDTGRFRGNWQVAIGDNPSFDLEVEVTDHASGGPGGVLAKVNGQVMQLKFGNTIWLVNNLPYAVALEYGHSSQAPGGMVRLTVQKWHPIVEKVAKELAQQ